MSAYPWPAKAEPLHYVTVRTAMGRPQRRKLKYQARRFYKYVATTTRRRAPMLTPDGREAWYAMHAKPEYTYGDAAFWRSFGCLFLWGDAEAILGIEA